MSRGARGATNGTSRPPQAESYATMSLRMRAWYDTPRAGRRRGCAWRDVRGLVVQLGLASKDEAPFLDIKQGLVYVIRDGSMSLYA